MDQIAANLKDPAWWFTVVFIGIIASLVASFARDAISAAAAKVSVRWNERREKKLAERSVRSDFLAANPSLLAIEYSCALRGLMQFVAGYVLVAFTAAYVFELTRFQLFPIFRAALVLASLGLAFLANKRAFESTGLFDICSDAKEKYEAAIRRGRSKERGSQEYDAPTAAS